MNQPMSVIVTPEDRKILARIVEDFARPRSEQQIFYFLCFCLCAPQTTHSNNLRVIRDLLKADFYNNYLHPDSLQEIVRPARFYKHKSDYLMAAKVDFPKILQIIRSGSNNIEKRTALVNSVKGMGWKVASHFLQKMGAKQLAVVDVHVVKFLGCSTPSNKRQYEIIETLFRTVAQRMDLTPAELDLLVWHKYSGTPFDDEYLADNESLRKDVR